MIDLAALRAFGRRPALYDDESADWLDYRDLADLIARARDRLAARVPRPLVFMFSDDRIDAVALYLAVLAGEGAIGLFPATLPPGRADQLIAHYRPHLVMGHLPACGYVERPGPGRRPWYQRQGEDTPPLHPQLGVLLSTSGSTGSPKLVRLSRAAIAANAHAIVTALAIRADERTILNLPLAYSYGLSVLNSHLVAGASVVLTRLALSGAGFWQRAAGLRVTAMPGVPMLYETLRRLDIERVAPASLRVMTQAGGKLSEPLTRHFHAAMAARGGRFFVMYGATEATARMAVLPPDLLDEKLGAAGVAIPGGRFEIAPGPSGGEIIYHGPNVMLGYAEGPEDLALGDVLHGRLTTGDLGRLDADGVLWIEGRASRIAKINGLRFNLDDVEALVAARFGPAAAIVEGNRLSLLIEAGNETESALRRGVALALALPPASLRVQPVACLPIGSNGKIDRDAVRRLVA